MREQGFTKFDNLSAELIVYTLNFLDRKTLAKSSSISKKLYDLSLEDCLWKKFVLLELTESPNLGKLTYKQYYHKIHNHLLKYSDNLNNTITEGEFIGLSPLVATVKEGLEILLKKFLSR